MENQKYVLSSCDKFYDHNFYNIDEFLIDMKPLSPLVDTRLPETSIRKNGTCS